MLGYVKMSFMHCVIFDVDIDRVTQEIIHQKMVHLVEINSLGDWTKSLNSPQLETQRETAEALRKRINQLVSAVSDKPLDVCIHSLQHTSPLENSPGHTTPPCSISTRDLFECVSQVEQIEEEFAPLLKKREERKTELENQKKIYNQIGTIVASKLGPAAFRYTFLETNVGKIKIAQYEAFTHMLTFVPHVAVVINRSVDMVTVFVVVLKRDKSVLQRALEETGFEEITIPEDFKALGEHAVRQMEMNITTLQQQIISLDTHIQQIQSATFPRLFQICRQVQEFLFLAKAEGYYKKTDRVYIISGWVAREKSNFLVETIKKLVKGKCYIELLNPEDIQGVREGKLRVPVQFSHPSFMRPFEFLVTTYNVPDYFSVNPTLVVALSFLLMFGAMFGDVGQGIVLLCSGIFFACTKKKKFQAIAWGLSWCGMSSFVFGLLYGSIFGNESIIPPLWLRPLHSIHTLILTAIGLGSIMVSLGILINIINAWRKKEIYRAFFDKTGLLGGIIYWAAIGLCIKMGLDKSVSLGWAWLFLEVPLLIFLIVGIVHGLLSARKKGKQVGIGEYLFEPLIDLLELGIGYLANTVSFLRVAAFSLAHAGLFIAIFSLAALMQKAGGGQIGWIFVHIFGNILIILLEGIVVAIQCIRLEYYEFFSKFFEGSGEAFQPIGKESE